GVSDTLPKSPISGATHQGSQARMASDDVTQFVPACNDPRRKRPLCGEAGASPGIAAVHGPSGRKEMLRNRVAPLPLRMTRAIGPNQRRILGILLERASR